MATAKKAAKKTATRTKAAKKPAKKASSEPAPRGRPTSYTLRVADEIVDRLCGGEPLAQICRDEHMPALRTVYDWQDANEEFSARIARAREVGFDVIAADTLRIADTPKEGVVEKMGVNEDGELFVVERRVEDMLGHRKLQIETRMKLLAKWSPRRFGEKIQLGGDPENPTPVSVGVVMIPAKQQDDD